MKRILIATAITALLAGPAMAGDGHGKGQKAHKGNDRAAAQRYDSRDHDRDRDWKADGRHDNGLHLGQRKQAWARGQAMPRTYLAPRYYVQDYNTYHLAPPPPGAVWVRPYPDSPDFYLVQVATGIISQIFGR